MRAERANFKKGRNERMALSGFFAVKRKSGQTGYTVLTGDDHLSKALGRQIIIGSQITADQKKEAECKGLMCHVNPAWAEEAQP